METLPFNLREEAIAVLSRMITWPDFKRITIGGQMEVRTEIDHLGVYCNNPREHVAVEMVKNGWILS